MRVAHKLMSCPSRISLLKLSVVQSPLLADSLCFFNTGQMYLLGKNFNFECYKKTKSLNLVAIRTMTIINIVFLIIFVVLYGKY